MNAQESARPFVLKSKDGRYLVSSGHEWINGRKKGIVTLDADLSKAMRFPTFRLAERHAHCIWTDVKKVAIFPFDVTTGDAK